MTPKDAVTRLTRREAGVVLSMDARLTPLRVEEPYGYL